MNSVFIKSDRRTCFIIGAPIRFFPDETFGLKSESHHRGMKFGIALHLIRNWVQALPAVFLIRNSYTAIPIYSHSFLNAACHSVTHSITFIQDNFKILSFPPQKSFCSNDGNAPFHMRIISSCLNQSLLNNAE